MLRSICEKIQKDKLLNDYIKGMIREEFIDAKVIENQLNCFDNVLQRVENISIRWIN